MLILPGLGATQPHISHPPTSCSWALPWVCLRQSHGRGGITEG